MRAAIVLAAALCLSACTTTQMQQNRRESNPAGVKGLLANDDLRQLSIADLVISFVPQATPLDPPVERPTSTPDSEQAWQIWASKEQVRIDKAVAQFYTTSNLTDAKRAQYRNEIQDRIIAASNQRCHLWKNFFATEASVVGFWSGVTSTAANAASLAFSPEGTKDALTALAATASGVGTQYQKDFLYSLSLSVIFQGVEGRRGEILARLGKSRQQTSGAPMPIDRYTLSGAIADALEYHAACSMASGLQQASEKMADSRDPKDPKPSTEPPAPPGSKDAAPKAPPQQSTEKNTASPFIPVL